MGRVKLGLLPARTGVQLLSCWSWCDSGPAVLPYWQVQVTQACAWAVMGVLGVLHPHKRERTALNRGALRSPNEPRLLGVHHAASGDPTARYHVGYCEGLLCTCAVGFLCGRVFRLNLRSNHKRGSLDAAGVGAAQVVYYVSFLVLFSAFPVPPATACAAAVFAVLRVWSHPPALGLAWSVFRAVAAIVQVPGRTYGGVLLDSTHTQR